MARISAACRCRCSLSRLLDVDGIFLSDLEQGEIGPDLFRHACLMGLEGMVSKHRESLYRGGRFRHWSRSKTGRIRRSAGFRISSETAPARAMRRFEVPEDNGFIAEPAPHALSHDGACADDVRADPR